MTDDERSPGIDLLSVAGATHLFAQAVKPPEVIPVPFPTWAESCRDMGGGEGLARGWHIVIGADTKQGKTLLALQCALTAVLEGRRVGFLNLEMSTEQIQTRLYSQATGIPAWRLEPGKSHDPNRARDVIQWLEDRGRNRKGVWLFTNEEPVFSLGEALELMHFWVEEWKCQLIVVDYLQLLEEPEAAGIADEVRKISARLTRFAKTHRIVTLGLSQFSNEGSQASPDARSLYGGRRIAQDASQCLFLDHSRSTYVPIDQKTRTWLTLKYNRHGPPADIPIEWDWRTLRARQALPDEEALWPRL